MQLPEAESLRAILAAAREYGVARLRVGSLDVHFAPPAPALPPVPIGEALLASINSGAPLPEDPIAAIKAAAARANGSAPLAGEFSKGTIVIGSAEDAMDVLASGRNLTRPLAGDPTEA